VIALAIALAIQGQEQLVGPPPPPMYRWINRQGQVRVTTTVPPLEATIIETMRRADDAVADVSSPALIPTPEEIRESMESVLKKETVAYWRGIDESLSAARRSGDSKAQSRALDGIFAFALLGNGLWAMPLVPALLVSICVLLAWWLSFGRSGRVQAITWVCFAVLCVLLSHVSIQVAIHGPQARRMGFALSVLPSYLGDYAMMDPEDGRVIAAHAVALSEASSPLSITWAFPLETLRTRQTLVRLLAKLESEVPTADALPMDGAGAE